ncbi:MAG TPA: TcpE family conjugal transfer membrane protein [Acidimicrobiales bacterium]|jgi:hypothetical protein|nr:TcpE family conjugal transfer membrane protein [Acidimicrobiales bacterium]
MTAERVECVTFTHARRHPMVLGKIGGWTMPWQLSVAQLVVLGVAYAVVFVARPLWAHLGPVNVLVLVAGPWVPAWLVRNGRVEGRDALRWLAGLGDYLAAPKHGECLGRRVRCPRPRSGGGWVRVGGR